MVRCGMVIGLSALVVGCATRAPPPAPSPSAVQAVQPAPSGRDYLAQAASLDLFAIEASKMALQQALDPRTREFASLMIRAHGGTSAQLSFAGRRLNVLPSTHMLAYHQAMLDELSASSDFDAAYRRQQIVVHQTAVKLHGDFAARGTSATLRGVARNALPIERTHLKLLRRL